MANFYCTCLSDRLTKRQSLREHKKLHPTTVDSEDICIHCGYYAIARPNLNHKIFPRPEYRKWDTEPSRSKAEWSSKGMLNEYYLYYHGHERGNQGLGDHTIRKDMERIKNEREQKLKRANGNRS
tara:strand:+ start:2302 stop:2676 length:375 start_codon:yes stop_codon:yes gene_type:complete